jgi:uncharacterized protein YbjT (DUF2867 family)
MILLTGITGKVGGAAAGFLLHQGIPFRGLARDPEKAAGLEGPGVEILRGDLLDADDVQKATRGISSALLVTPNGRSQLEMERRFARIAADSGVGHLVKISTIRATPDTSATFPRIHHQSEEFIKSLGVRWSMLRANFFMQNFLMCAGSICANDEFSLPLGRTPLGMIDTRDVAEIAVRRLLDTGTESASHDISGPEWLNCDEVASRMSAVLGREIRYIDQDLSDFRALMERVIPDPWHVDALCRQFEENATRELVADAGDTTRLLGHAPRTLDSFLRDYSESFGG